MNAGELDFKQTGTNQDDQITDNFLQDSSTLVVVGYTHGTLPGTSSLPGRDGFIAFVDISSKDFTYYQSGSSGDDRFYDIKRHPNGKYYFTGYTSGELPENTSEGGDDAFLGMFDPSTKEFKFYQLGTSGDEKAFDLHINSQGWISISGETSGIFPDNTAAGGEDGFVATFVVPPF
jgi:hypothetical protein